MLCNRFAEKRKKRVSLNIARANDFPSVCFISFQRARKLVIVRWYK